MTLHDTIQSDGLTVFCNAYDFAEPATYLTRFCEPRTIQVVIDRQALAVLTEDGDVITPVFEIHVHNNSTTGIASDELNLGGDALEFATRVGQCPTQHSIVRLLSHDEGMLVLECR
jgi:hypothetical protein